jgi:hypothetical protein
MNPNNTLKLPSPGLSGNYLQMRQASFTTSIECKIGQVTARSRPNRCLAARQRDAVCPFFQKATVTLLLLF